MGATATEQRTDHRLGFTTLDAEVSVESLPVTGTIPDWLEGALVRTGPARFEAGERPLRHWFDGLAMLHRFAIGGGGVGYANRYLRSEAYKAATEDGRVGFSEFATDPCRSIFKRVTTMFSPGLTDNGVVNVVRAGDRHLAMTETPLPVEFDPETLETLGVSRIDERGDGQVTTAHPHHDRRRDALVNYVAKLGPRSSYRVYLRGPNDARRRMVGEVPVRHPAYMHSFGLTERYAVLAEPPLVVDPLRLAVSARPFIENYRWEPERGTRFWLVPLDGGAPAGPFETEPFFAFHHVNAFESEEGEVVVDLCAYPDSSIIDALYLEALRGAHRLPRPHFRRVRIDLREGSVRTEVLADPGFDLPRINYRDHNARPYRHVWGVRADGPWLDRIVKLDLEEGEAATWAAESCFPGEPVFVPAPGARDEDDGVILSVVLDAAREASSLVVLHAATLEEIARAEVPHHIPHSFHGQFFGD